VQAITGNLYFFNIDAGLQFSLDFFSLLYPEIHYGCYDMLHMLEVDFVLACALVT
jgi:hypothetical protein